MKITAVSTLLAAIPFTNGGAAPVMAGQPYAKMNILFVKIDTDEGVTGWGEAFGHSGIRATKTMLDTLVAPLFVGRDPTDIAGLMHEMFQKLHIFGRNGAPIYALSGMDIALWDIAGKRAGLPLYQLLGGSRRTSLAAYASMQRYGDPAVVGENAARAAAEGYRYIKLHEIDVPQVKAAREAVGPDIELMMDTNCPWTVDEAVAMARRLEPFRLYWLEEPVWPPENHEGIARVRRTGPPIAAGENAAGLHDFRHMFEAGALDIAQPSITKIGGVSEMRKIATLAEAYGVRMVPHTAYFGPGALASLHVTAALPHDTLMERLFLDLETSPFPGFSEAKDGRIAVPQGPGLGCDPDARMLERYLVEPATVTR